jgi:hypothetical protein
MKYSVYIYMKSNLKEKQKNEQNFQCNYLLKIYLIYHEYNFKSEKHNKIQSLSKIIALNFKLNQQIKSVYNIYIY